MDLILRIQDSGRTVHVAVGATFAIELDENRTTGYVWSQPEFDEKGLALESSESITVPRAAVGGGGVRRLVFKATAAGTGTVRLIYKRPWEADAASSARFDVTVVRSL